MRTVLITIALSVGLSGPAYAIGNGLPADAQSAVAHVEQIKKGGKYKNKDKYKYQFKSDRGGCKYEYKADKKGVREKYKCK